ncbi:YqhA family protein [Xanthobacteraceae bacterium A53D]
MRRVIAQIVILSRWAMLPLFAGLALTLVVVVAAFAKELWHLAQGIFSYTATQTIMGILTLIDLMLVGGLLVVIIASGYENFIERIDRRDAPDTPQWMTRISFSGLKLKLFASLMAIAGITLLKALMGLESNVSEAQVRWLMAANVIFVAAYVALALVDRRSGGQDD